MREGSNMSIQRVPEVPFAQIANTALRDARLSFKARGVLAMVLSNVGEWQATAKWIEMQSEKDGPHAIQTALNELTELGYRRVTTERLPDGTLRTITTWFHEPQMIRPADNPVAGESDGRITQAALEDHLTEHHQQNTTREIVRKPVGEVSPDRFEDFWQTYPRKSDKGHARRAWVKAIRKADPTLIIEGAVRYRNDPNREPEFTALAATWLNGERWDDEPLPSRNEDRKLDEVQQMIARAAQRDQDRLGI